MRRLLSICTFGNTLACPEPALLHKGEHLNSSGVFGHRLCRTVAHAAKTGGLYPGANRPHLSIRNGRGTVPACGSLRCRHSDGQRVEGCEDLNSIEVPP